MKNIHLRRYSLRSSSQRTTSTPRTFSCERLASGRFSATSRKAGFTLIEVIVTITLMSTLLALGLILSLDVYRGTVYRSTRQVLISSLNTARGRALTNMYQSTHGVCYRAPDFIIFRGTNYSATSPYNETIEGNPAVTLTSQGDFFTCGSGVGIVFSQLSATTTNTGVITVTEAGHADETVSVNSLGAILW